MTELREELLFALAAKGPTDGMRVSSEELATARKALGDGWRVEVAVEQGTRDRMGNSFPVHVLRIKK